MFTSAKGEREIELIFSRLEEDVKALFENYDVDDSYSFDFHEFTRVCLKMQADASGSLFTDDVRKVYLDLADSLVHHVWPRLLDLIVKIRGSKERIPILARNL